MTLNHDQGPGIFRTTRAYCKNLDLGPLRADSKDCLEALFIAKAIAQADEALGNVAMAEAAKDQPDVTAGCDPTPRLKREEAERKAAATQQAEYQRSQAEEQRKYDRMLADRGYKRITFEDFELDGRELAASQAKISIHGFYKKTGDIEMLLPSTGSDSWIGLMTEGANRNARKMFLTCRTANPWASCPFTILGHVSMCTRTTLVGSKEVPCLIVDDTWNIARR
jgi:hypothetical protein